MRVKIKKSYLVSEIKIPIDDRILHQRTWKVVKLIYPNYYKNWQLGDLFLYYLKVKGKILGLTNNPNLEVVSEKFLITEKISEEFKSVGNLDSKKWLSLNSEFVIPVLTFRDYFEILKKIFEEKKAILIMNTIVRKWFSESEIRGRVTFLESIEPVREELRLLF